MKNLIENEIKNIKSELPKLSGLREEYLFSLVCFRYFFNNGRLSHKDYEECFVDAKDDGGIDLVTINEDTNDNTISLVLIQSKLISKIPNSPDIIFVFDRIIQTLADFSDYRYAKYNKRVKRILKEQLDFLEDKASSKNLVLFLSVDPTPTYKQKLQESIDNYERFADYRISVFYRNDIEEKISSILEPMRFVKEEKVRWAKEDGKLEYCENGVMVNIHSNSLRDLYDKYRDRGLFEQNFRYYITNKKIDDKITESLRNKRNDFWYLNNGIIIGCKDFFIDGDFIKLYNFSIINGCQTVTLIGRYTGGNQDLDFVLPCKIVKPKKGKDKESEFLSFISEIAEASNSQKPITDRDLKSNRPEQKILQSGLRTEEPKIYLEIKRGELTPKRGLLDWQYVKNDYLGQLILSFYLQRPCMARNSKSKIFSDEMIYSKVFKREHDRNSLVDLLRLDSYYGKFLEKISDEAYSDMDRLSIAIYGTFMVVSVIALMIKVKRNLIDLKKLGSNDWEDEIQKDNIKGSLFSDYTGDDFEDRLNSLFMDIVEVLFQVFNIRKTEDKTVTSFLKSDNKYQNLILSFLVNHYFSSVINRKEIEKKYMVIFQ